MTPDPYIDRAALRTLPLEEKAALVSGVGPYHTHAIPAIGLPAAEVGDGPHGLRTETGVEMVWIPSTGFPTGSALGATWDRGLVGEVAAAIGEEARAIGVQVLLGPGVNMKRTPLCGRNFEYFSEDPLLAGELAGSYISGVQSTGVGACLKHFAANNQETWRTEVSVEADERTLREIYLEAFRRAIEAADPWSVMCSYNRIGGVHASQNSWLLTEVLREDWGYLGAVVSDWDAVHDPVAAVRAGLDLEMPGTDGRSAGLIADAVRAGELDETVLDRAAERVVRLVERTLPGGRSVEGPVRAEGIVPGAELTDSQAAALGASRHHELARRASVAAHTLLRNEGGALPLDPASGRRLAVIGGFAETPRIQGGGSSGVQPIQVDTPLSAIRRIAGDDVAFAPGYAVPSTTFYTEEAWPTDLDERRRLIAEAVEVARAAETMIVFVGLPLSDEVEALDRTTLALPEVQLELLAALAEVGTPMIVVLAAGSAVTMDPWHDAADAILLTWLGGEAMGAATAEVLFGIAEPEGRLGETFPLRLADTPAYGRFPGKDRLVHYSEGVLIGYRWYDAKRIDVRYPFGHGLSYTSFEYSDPRVRAAADPQGGFEVELTMRNSGSRPGSEVVQLYVGELEPTVVRAPRELRGFEKVRLAPGAETRVAMRVTARDLAYFDEARSRWTTPAGAYRIDVGASSRDLRVSVSVSLGDEGIPEALRRP
ncbi:glycoside hydrolase family 3 C-terminal domain-containing protein [Homoserinibacter sp. GY 40078]|uniref:beta-glucosidase n=1 Tax=Homoserinibacter sp. GY 40078 TaxID=2603275 RepID=UPI0011CA0DE3|nr:glycoside hydrolase family 3 C-terminal domain-containing protein [Homoserinibacter sp. GY 40078]TXK18902.1 beta-glucosidase [Homoserinibacter sp. GY 40078]